MTIFFMDVTTQWDPTCGVVGSWHESAPLGFACANGYSILIKLNTERSHMSQKKSDEHLFLLPCNQVA